MSSLALHDNTQKYSAWNTCENKANIVCFPYSIWTALQALKQTSKDVFSLFPGVRVYINILMRMALRRLNQGWIYPQCLVMKTEPVSLMSFMSHNATGHLYSCISSLSDELVTACSYRGWPNSHTCTHTRFIVTNPMFMHKLSRTCPCMLMTAREWISAVYSPVPIVFRLH